MTAPRRAIDLLLAAALAGLGWAVWQAALSGGFIFDDLPNLVHADGWKATSLHWPALAAAMTSGLTSEGGRPLAILSFAINHALTGLDPWWLKATSLALHLANGLLAWRLAGRLLAAGTRGSLSPRSVTIAAWIVVAAWIVHPIHASTVPYVVQRMEIGAATGVLVALLCYIRFRDRQLAGRIAWPWLIAATAGVLAGLGFKESAAIAPVLALLVEWLCFRFRSAGGGVDRRITRAYLLGAAVAAAGFVAVVLPMTGASAYAARGFDAVGRTSTQFPVLVHYLGLIAWPDPDAFRFYYDDFRVSARPWSTAWTALATAVVLALAAAAWCARRRWPLAAFGIAWFLACHAITSSPIPLELAFEHRNYLASLGILLSAAAVLAATTARLNGDARTAITGALLGILVALGALQSATWANPMRLALTLEARAPQSSRAGYGLATRFIDAARGDRTSPAWSLGMATLRRAGDLPSATALPTQAEIILLARGGQPIDAATWSRFRARLTRRPLGPEATESLYAVVNCRVRGACRFDDGELLATVIAVVAANPRHATAYTLYANVAWNVLHDRPLAIRLQREAVRFSAGGAEQRLGLAEFLLASGEPAARAEALAALRGVRGSGDARRARAAAALERRHAPTAAGADHAGRREPDQGPHDRRTSE